ncbi:MAG: M67 family metallopeptidase [Lachnospiraceae bacterium]|nr:M67 family metallopeptidase [Lachnospiraceae bacterium]
MIAGTTEDGIAKVRKAYLLTNVDASREHFSIDPKEHMEAIKDMRANGYIPLGNWHSHPETPARPSEEDKRLAYDSKALYLILSLRNQRTNFFIDFAVCSSIMESVAKSLLDHGCVKCRRQDLQCAEGSR